MILTPNTASLIFTEIGLFLTVIALGLAIWQTYAAKDQTNKLRHISDALSTKYLGTFPEYVPRIGELIGKTKRELLVLCTIPTHAVFSAYDDWLSIKHAIEKVQKQDHKVKVSCVFSSAEVRRSFLVDQFHDAKADWKTWKSNYLNSSRLEIFLSTFGKGRGIAESTFETFIDLFESAGNEALASTYKGAELLEVPYRPSLYMWVVDGKEAVFGMSTLAPMYISEAFSTNDPKLIDALIKMHLDCRHKSSEVRTDRDQYKSSKY